MRARTPYHRIFLSLKPMASVASFLLYFAAAAAAAAAILTTPSHAGLVPENSYLQCPQALTVIRNIVNKAIRTDTRMAASLLRLHYLDCFVNGCDGSVLLDDTADFTGEKTARPNLNSLRAFDVVDQIKLAVNEACHGNVVSCADILAIAARDSVSILGGPLYTYTVYLGRYDSRTASIRDANTNLPSPFFNFSQLLSSFQSHGLDLQDLVVLSAGHSIGLARCATFRNRIYYDTDIDSNFAALLRSSCLQNGGDDVTNPLDSTATRFDTTYFEDLIQKKGLLRSDQQLYKGDGSKSDQLVQYYRDNPLAFALDFGVSMIKMGNMKPLTETNGEIRRNCTRVNN